MKPFTVIRRHLGLKIFISYLVVMLVGIVVMLTGALYQAPAAFSRHLTSMEEAAATPGALADLEADLLANFHSAFNESLLFATLAAFVASLSLSIFVSRQIVAPIQRMMTATRRIADGQFSERVEIPGAVAEESADELDQLALSFNQMAQRLERVEEMRRQLIGDVAHELRTPLTTIQGTMEGILDGVIDHNDEAYRKVHGEAVRLQRLVRDLEKLSRVEGGQITYNPRPVKPIQIAAKVASLLEIQFHEKGVDLRLEIKDDETRVLVDEHRIGQVMLNLVGNALQYTPSGGWVGISGRRSNGFFEFRIRDTGTGIEAQHLPHVFTRFYRVDKSRSRAGGGSGVGLTIAKSIVEASGGKIRVDSKGRGKGSTFTFTVPIAE